MRNIKASTLWVISQKKKKKKKSTLWVGNIRFLKTTIAICRLSLAHKVKFFQIEIFITMNDTYFLIFVLFNYSHRILYSMFTSRKHWRGWEGAVPESDAVIDAATCASVSLLSYFYFLFSFFFFGFTSIRADSCWTKLIRPKSGHIG